MQLFGPGSKSRVNHNINKGAPAKVTVENSPEPVKRESESPSGAGEVEEAEEKSWPAACPADGISGFREFLMGSKNA